MVSSTCTYRLMTDLVTSKRVIWFCLALFSSPLVTTLKSLMKIRIKTLYTVPYFTSPHSDSYPLSTSTTFCLLPVSHSLIRVSTLSTTPTPLTFLADSLRTASNALQSPSRWCQSCPPCSRTPPASPNILASLLSLTCPAVTHAGWR